MNKLLVFDIWGNYAHYKQIYATTSAISYPIPFKTAIYGYVSAILGFNKIENNYLKYFQDGNCKIGLQLLNEISTTRINTNLRAEFGMLKAGGKCPSQRFRPPKSTWGRTFAAGARRIAV